MTKSVVIILTNVCCYEESDQLITQQVAEIEMEGQYWVEKNDSGHKNSFFKSHFLRKSGKFGEL